MLPLLSTSTRISLGLPVILPAGVCQSSSVLRFCRVHGWQLHIQKSGFIEDDLQSVPTTDCLVRLGMSVDFAQNIVRRSRVAEAYRSQFSFSIDIMISLFSSSLLFYSRCLLSERMVYVFPSMTAAGVLGASIKVRQVTNKNKSIERELRHRTRPSAPPSRLLAPSIVPPISSG